MVQNCHHTLHTLFPHSYTLPTLSTHSSPTFTTLSLISPTISLHSFHTLFTLSPLILIRQCWQGRENTHSYPKWCQMFPYGPKRFLNGPKCSEMLRSGPKWSWRSWWGWGCHKVVLFLSLYACWIQNMFNLNDTLKKNHQDCHLLQNHPSNGVLEVSDIRYRVKDDSHWFHVVTLAIWNPEHVKYLWNLEKNHLNCHLLQNHPSKTIPEVPDCVRDAPRWFNVVTPAMLNTEHVKSPWYLQEKKH